MVGEWMRSNVIDLKSIDRRMCVLRIRGKFKKYRYFFAHAPVEEDCERERYQIYECIKESINSAPCKI
jgi:hypothetical protein